MTQASLLHQRKIHPTCYFQFSDKINSGNNNFETEFNSQAYVLSSPVNWAACGCFCTCHSNFCGFHREESWMHSLAGKPTTGDTPMPRESPQALDDMLPNWPNLSPPVVALENTCTCCWLWQMNCQLLLPVVTRE